MKIEEWVRKEQASLWDDLANDLHFAANGNWSIASANRARRIVEAARLVGATPNGEVPWVLVAGGVYAEVLRAGGLEPELPSEDEWHRLDNLMAEHGGRRSQVMVEMAGTVTALRDDRERRWVAGEDE